jgi:hypothetical protein
MALYTFIAEYRGGTYIQQLRGDNPADAFRKYAANANWVAKTQRTGFFKALSEDCSLPLTQIERTEGVWCVTQTFRGMLLMINIVETSELGTE